MPSEIPETNPFDPGIGDYKSRVEKFIEKYCVHTKDVFAGKQFNLQPWQRKVLREIYDDVDEEGYRNKDTYLLMVPRKNGKSEMAAALCLYHLLADNTPGAEIYGAAKSREQANVVFDAVKRMIALSPLLSELVNQGRLQVKQHSINFTDSMGTVRLYKPLSHEGSTAHGLNPSTVIIDELHTWTGVAGREFYEALTSGQGARRQPLTLIISTAGYDKQSILYEQYMLAKDIAKGVKSDPSFGSCIFEAEEGDDWRDPAVWAKANPNLGVSVFDKFLETQVQKAENSPSETNKIRRFYLNQWTESATVFIALEAWDACQQSYTPEDLAGRPCFGGLDLASTTDLASFSLVFPPISENEPYKTLSWSWLPADNMRERVLRDQVYYDKWAEEGWVRLTDGNVIDYGAIQGHIINCSQLFELRQVNIDPWNASGVTTRLQDEGIACAIHRQGFGSMSSPTKSLLAYVLSKRLAHNGNPVLRWNVANLTVRQDDNGNVAPSKKLSRERIDGAVSTIMALGGALGAGQQSDYLDYNGEELLVL